MSDHDDFLKCPLCQGRGEIRRAEMIERLTDPDLKPRIDSYLAGITKTGDEPNEFTTAGANARKTRDFQKEVHSWNPQLPIWRRSPKE